MEIINHKSPYLFVLISIMVCFRVHSKALEAHMEIPVGVILDMESWVGKTVNSCISLAVSDFYAINSHYKTRIVLHNRDTHGEPLHALSAALDLLEKRKVKAILGSQSTSEAKFLSVLGHRATIPILSLSPILSSNKHPYFLRVTQDEKTQVKAIASLLLSFGWNNANIIFEDTEDGRDVATCMANSFQENSITITYMSHISTTASKEVLQEELYKLSNSQTKLYIVHASHSLASHIFRNAKYLGMMDVGYKWVVTSKTMNFMHLMDDEVIECMQGVVGFKTYIPKSRNLNKLSLRLRKEYKDMELKDISSYAIRAYDGVSALAMAVEKTHSVLKLKIKDLKMTSLTQWSTTLLNQMLRISYDGLSGNFKFSKAKVKTQVLEVVNVIGKEEVKIGFWRKNVAFTKKIGNLNSLSDHGLESIMWPGGVLNNTLKMLQVNSRHLRVGIPMRSRSGNLFQVKFDAPTNSTLVSGFCSDVFQIAFNSLDPSVTFEFIPHVGTYDGLINQVRLGIFDAAIGDISITANRLQNVDFTIPYTDLGTATLYRNVDETTNMWIFMKPLSSDLWLVVACFFILLGFVIWILEHRTNDEFQGSPIQQLGATLWFAFSTLVYAQRQKLENNLSRFVVTIWLFVVLVLVSSYTATLSSLLTVEQIQLASTNGVIGFPDSSVIHQHFIGEWKHTKLRSYHTLEEVGDALSLGSKKGGVDAIVYEIPYIKEFLVRFPYGYSVVMSEDITNGFGFVFPKDSPFTREISIQIAKLREDGTLRAIDNKWFGQQSDPLAKDLPPSLKILDFKELRGLFIISGISMGVALFIFILHYVHEKLVHYTYVELRGGNMAFIFGSLWPFSTIGVGGRSTK